MHAGLSRSSTKLKSTYMKCFIYFLLLLFFLFRFYFLEEVNCILLFYFCNLRKTFLGFKIIYFSFHLACGIIMKKKIQIYFPKQINCNSLLSFLYQIEKAYNIIIVNYSKMDYYLFH